MERVSLLEVKDLTVQKAGNAVLNRVSFSVQQGECLAVVGASGSGKSTLIKALTEKYFCNGSINFLEENGKTPGIATISHQHQFKNLSNTSSFYYQQRFNSLGSDDAMTVNDGLLMLNVSENSVDETLSLLGIMHVKFSPLIQLSNGEHKRFQLAKAVLQNAQWLLLDSPYVGLDIAARKLLNKIIDLLVSKGMHILLATSSAEMPQAVTHIALLENGVLQQKIIHAEFIKLNHSNSTSKKLLVLNTNDLANMLPAYSYSDFSVAIDMKDTNVEYHKKRFLII